MGDVLCRRDDARCAVEGVRCSGIEKSTYVINCSKIPVLNELDKGLNFRFLGKKGVFKLKVNS